MTAVTAAAVTVTLAFAHSFVRFSPFSISTGWLFALCYCYHSVHTNRLLGLYFPTANTILEFDKRVCVCVTVSIGLDWIFFCLFRFSLYHIYFAHKKQRNNNWFLTLTLFDFDFTSYTELTCHSKYGKLVFNYSFSWFFFRQNCFTFRRSSMMNIAVVDTRKLFHSAQHSKTVSGKAKKVEWKHVEIHLAYTNGLSLGALEIQVNVDNNGVKNTNWHV